MISRLIGDFFKDTWNIIQTESTVLAVLGGLLFLFLIMAGSKKAKTWLYWTVIGYALVQIIGLIGGAI